MSALRTFCCVLLLSIGLVAVCGQDKMSGISDIPDGKAVFRNTFPSYVSFRGETVMPRQINYHEWLDKVGDADIIIKKFMQEEIDVDTKSREWCSKFLRQNPEKTILLHLNGEGRQITEHEDVLDRYFPGHWVYMAGSDVINDISVNDDVVYVKDVVPFKHKGYIKRNTVEPEYIPLKVIIVSLNTDGRRQWYRSEYATVTGFDEATGAVSLKRGLYGSKPLSYKGGKAYMAPIAAAVWGKDAMWYYNLSSVCPKDSSGRMANEVYADEIRTWFDKDGPLAGLDGIAFDVNYFNRIGKGLKWDVDNDGVADAGWINGRNVWMDGDLKFLSLVRKYLGQDRIITCDAQLPTNQQTPYLLNGIESEGLIEPLDSWRGFSRMLNTHDYWMKRIGSPYKFRYVVMKINGNDAPRADEIRKFSAATAFCMGAAVTSAGNRAYVPAEFRKQGSLGHIVGDLIRVAKTAPAAIDMAGEILYESVDTSGISVRLDDGKVYVKPDSPDRNAASFRFNINNVVLPEGDITVFLKVKATEPLTDYSEKYRIPRLVKLRPVDLPVYESDPKYDKFHTDLYGMIDCSEPGELSFYFRNLPGGENTLELEVTGTGEIEISGLRIFNDPDVLVREFENGIIVVNPSLETVEIPIRKYVAESVTETVAVPPVDAAYIFKK